MTPALQQSVWFGRRLYPPFSKPASSSSSSARFPSVAERPRLPALSSRPAVVALAAALNANAQTRERQRLKEQFEAAYKRCCTAPMEGVSFTVEEFLNALDKYDFDTAVGTKVKGTVFSTDLNGAVVEVAAKSLAFLPVQEACIYRVKHVAEAGIFPGFQGEFIIVSESEEDDILVLSLQPIQYRLAWERCRQLQAEDVVVKAKVIEGKKGGVVVIVESLRGLVPFSQILTKSGAKELIGKELPLKFMEVDEEQSRLVLSNSKALTDNQVQLGIGSVVTGTVQSLKPYGAFVEIGGLTGLLHISQISHNHVPDVSAVLQPGDILKLMILSHDCENGRVSLSTKKLEPTPGDMIHNPKLVFEKANEMAQLFQQRIAQSEEMARSEMRRFQLESGFSPGSEFILGPLSPDSPADGLDSSDAPAAAGM